MWNDLKNRFLINTDKWYTLKVACVYASVHKHNGEYTFILVAIHRNKLYWYIYVMVNVNGEQCFVKKPR